MRSMPSRPTSRTRSRTPEDVDPRPYAIGRGIEFSHQRFKHTTSIVIKHGISYLIKGSRMGTITDPASLQEFYRRMFKRRHEEETKKASDRTRRGQGEQR